jgi:hypothetical protein
MGVNKGAMRRELVGASYCGLVRVGKPTEISGTTSGPRDAPLQRLLCLPTVAEPHTTRSAKDDAPFFWVDECWPVTPNFTLLLTGPNLRRNSLYCDITICEELAILMVIRLKNGTFNSNG